MKTLLLRTRIKMLNLVSSFRGEVKNALNDETGSSPVWIILTIVMGVALFAFIFYPQITAIFSDLMADLGTWLDGQASSIFPTS